MVQRKFLFVGHDRVACEFCGRTLLTGERAEFVAEPGEQLQLACELCAPVARRDGWLSSEAPSEPFVVR